jgi:Ca2+-binding RTX toxin-like protein
MMLIGCDGREDQAIFQYEGDGIERVQRTGSALPDKIEGTNDDERFEGLAGSDTLIGNGGRDEFYGGPGNDVLLGGPDNDTYFVFLGDNTNIVRDEGGADDRIIFGPGVTFEQLLIVHEPVGTSLVIRTSKTPEGVLIMSDGSSDGEIETYIVSGKQYSVSDIDAAVDGNRRPKLVRPIGGKVAFVGELFELEIPSDTFQDPDSRDKLRISMRQPRSVRLPSWLSFDNEAMRLSGTPAKADIGEYELYLDAKDPGRRVARHKFRINVVDRE